MANPQVMVNPLSIITPGIFREIFQMTPRGSPRAARAIGRARRATAHGPPARRRRACRRDLGRAGRDAGSRRQLVGGDQRRRREKEIGARASPREQIDASSAYIAVREQSSIRIDPALAQLCRAVARGRSALRPCSRSGILPLHPVAPGKDLMEKRKLGNSGDRDRAAHVRRQRVRLDGRRGDLVQAARRASSAPASTPSTPPTSIRAGSPGNKGGESETIIGNWLKAARRARQGRHRHQGRHGDAGHRQGALEGLHPPGGRGLAAAPADRLHRPLPVAHRRPGSRRSRRRSAPTRS